MDDHNTKVTSKCIFKCKHNIKVIAVNKVMYISIKKINKIIQGSNGIIYGSNIRDIYLRRINKINYLKKNSEININYYDPDIDPDTSNRLVVPSQIDVLLNKKDEKKLFDNFGKEYRISNYEYSSDEENEEDKIRNGYKYMADYIYVNSYQITSNNDYIGLNLNIRMNLTVFNNDLDLTKIFQTFDFDVNSLYLSNGTVGYLFGQYKNPIQIGQDIDRIKKSIEKCQALYIGKKDINEHWPQAIYRKSIFIKTIDMLLNGWNVMYLAFSLVAKNAECPICRHEQDIFVKNKCCNGVSCVKCFKTHVLIELDSRITYRCMFHRSEDNIGYNVIPGLLL